jgi:hypothetical protein
MRMKRGYDSVSHPVEEIPLQSGLKNVQVPATPKVTPNQVHVGSVPLHIS